MSFKHTLLGIVVVGSKTHLPGTDSFAGKPCGGRAVSDKAGGDTPNKGTVSRGNSGGYGVGQGPLEDVGGVFAFGNDGGLTVPRTLVYRDEVGR